MAKVKLIAAVLFAALALNGDSSRAQSPAARQKRVRKERAPFLMGLREVRLMDDTDYALGRTRVEYQRLIEQAELFRPLTERLLRAAGIGAGMQVLDVGCGAGDVSFLVSEIVGPRLGRRNRS
jgi:protein-L-isoaspartate O-methyltransferase